MPRQAHQLLFDHVAAAIKKLNVTTLIQTWAAPHRTILELLGTQIVRVFCDTDKTNTEKLYRNSKKK
jgi:hypothetical protein